MITHGHRRRGKYIKEYSAWNHMRQRCNNPAHPRYADYGGRGIKVCERWNLFKNFIADVGFAPSPKHTLDRYPDNNGHYEPGNVRWATTAQQSLNTRQNKILTLNGVSKTATEWAKSYGINHRTLTSRLRKGWNLETAIKTPTLDKYKNLKSYRNKKNITQK